VLVVLLSVLCVSQPAAATVPIFLVPIIVQGWTRVTGGIVFTTIVRHGNNITVNTQRVAVSPNAKPNDIQNLVTKKMMGNPVAISRFALGAQALGQGPVHIKKIVEVGERTIGTMRMFSARPELALQASGKFEMQLVSSNTANRIVQPLGVTRTFSAKPTAAQAYSPRQISPASELPQIPMSTR